MSHIVSPLADVDGIDIVDNDRLVSLADFALVATLQSVGIYQNDALTRIDLPITSARRVTVADNPKLTTCVIEAWLDGVDGVASDAVMGVKSGWSARCSMSSSWLK